MTPDESRHRFAELIWRTVKLRVSLLIVSAVMLLVTWSALTNGNIEAAKLDVSFCNQLEDETADLLPGWPKDQFNYCSVDLARLMVENDRAIEHVLPLEGERFAHRKAEFTEYDQKRRAAYKLEIGLSSEGTGSKVIVNALSVAKVVPFIVVLILSAVAVLGFQQDTYRHRLKILLRRMEGEELDAGIASGQFLSGFAISNVADSRGWMVISPEGLAIRVLLAGVSYLLLAVLAAFIVNLIHLTNSIFLNYLFVLYAFSFVLAVALWRTHLKYREHSEQEPKRAFRWFVRGTRWLNVKWCIRVLVAVAILSVFLPWARTPLGQVHTFKGYNFILKQKPIFQRNAHTHYPVDPRLFAEIRFQLVPVAIFLISCVVSSLLPRGRRTWAKMLKSGNWALALTTVFLSLNYLLYMGTLQYGALTGTDISSSLLDTSLDMVRGFSMNWYDPAYGFIVFLFCCLTLAWISLRQTDIIKQTWK